MISHELFSYIYSDAYLQKNDSMIPFCFGAMLGAAERDYRTSRQWVLLGCAVVVTFVIYYLLWIRRMTDVSAMRDW